MYNVDRLGNIMPHSFGSYNLNTRKVTIGLLLESQESICYR